MCIWWDTFFHEVIGMLKGHLDMDGLLSRLIALLILLLLVITKCNTWPEILLPDMLMGQKKRLSSKFYV